MANTVTLIVRARNATGAAFRAVRGDVNRLSGFMTSRFRSMGRDAGNSFGNGLRGGIGSAFATAMKNPYIAATVVAVGLALGSLMGAAIAGALVLAFGGAFVGLGVLLTLQNKKLKAEWGKTIKDIKRQYTGLSKPMEEVTTTARKNLQKMAKDFAPYFKKAMKDAAPAVSTFLDYFTKGIEKFGKKAFGPMMTAFQDLLDTFGPEFEDFMGELGNAFAELATQVSNNKQAVAQALHIVLGTITAVIWILAELTRSWGLTYIACLKAVNGIQNAWTSVQEGLGAAASSILRFLRMIIDGVLAAAQYTLVGMAKMMSALGMKGAAKGLQSAADAVGRFRNRVKSSMGDAIAATDRFNQRAKDAGKERHLKMNIASWKQALSAAEARLKHVPKSKQTVLKALIADLKRKISEAQGKINSLHGKTVGIGIAYHITNPGLLRAAHGGYTGGVVGGTLRKRASGGMGGSGTTLVGEHGPEMVNLPTGSHISSNPDTKRRLRGGGGDAAIIEIRSSGSRTDDLLLEILRNAVRVRGGNVQLVVGGRKVA